MSSFFALPGNNYGAQTLVFALTVVLLALPVAALIAASLLEGLTRQLSGPRLLAPAPLSLRRSPVPTRRNARPMYVGSRD